MSDEEMSDEESCYLLKPVIRQDKNIVYKGKKYLVDFQLLQQYSNYFYNHREEYAYKSDIEIPSELLEGDDSSIEIFIKSIQNEKFTINERNVFSLNLLSSTYEIPSLKEHTNKYIAKHGIDLVLRTLLYKKRLNYKNAQENNNGMETMNTKEEEETIATNIEKYINNDELVKLPVSVLYRILNHPKLNAISEDQINRFLFKCLEEHKRQASVLFLNERLNILSEENFLHLFNEYKDIFDFELIGCRQIVELLNQMKQSKEELAKYLKETEDNLGMQNRQLAEEKDKLCEQNRQINEEKDKLCEQNRQINEEKNKLCEQNRQINEEKNKLCEQNLQINEEKNKLCEQNQQINEEKDKLLKEIYKTQKDRDYLRSFVDRIRAMIPYKNDDEMIKIIEDDMHLSTDVRDIFQGCNSNEIPGFIRKDTSLSYNIRKFFNSGDDQFMINQIKTDHDRIQEMIDLENKLKQQEIKEKENDKIINQMKEDNLRLLEENNKLKEKQLCNEMTIDCFNKLPFQEQLSAFEELPSNEMTNKIKNLLNYLSRDKNITNTCIEILCQQNDKITRSKTASTRN